MKTNRSTISNLSTIFKIINSPSQSLIFKLSPKSISAYAKNYPTETTLLSMHDYLSNAIAHQQVSCLCLLDLSAAFDTLDHSILLTRLSTWFGIFSISRISLCWFRSYLSSSSSSLSIGGTPRNITISCGVPQGSVLRPIFFNFYNTPSAL